MASLTDGMRYLSHTRNLEPAADIEDITRCAVMLPSMLWMRSKCADLSRRGEIDCEQAIQQGSTQCRGVTVASPAPRICAPDAPARQGARGGALRAASIYAPPAPAPALIGGSRTTATSCAGCCAAARRHAAACSRAGRSRRAARSSGATRPRSARRWPHRRCAA